MNWFRCDTGKRRCFMPLVLAAVLITIWPMVGAALESCNDQEDSHSNCDGLEPDLVGPPTPIQRPAADLIRAMEEGQGPLSAVTIQYRDDPGRRYVKHVVVDASDDGGMWWFPQGSGFRFDANEDHQGKHLADWMRAQGWKVTEIGRHGRVNYALLEGADLVIRGGASFDNQRYGTSGGRTVQDTDMYEDSELEGYRKYVMQGGLVLLLGQELDTPNGSDPLVAALGYTGNNAWNYENGFVILEDHFPLEIFRVTQPRTDLLFEQVWQRSRRSESSEQEETAIPMVVLLSPADGVTLPQGGATWEFRWRPGNNTDIKGWHILVYRRGAGIPLIKRFTSKPSYRYRTGGGVFVERNCSHWLWKVRVVRSDGKTGPWSDLRSFQITPPER